MVLTDDSVVVASDRVMGAGLDGEYVMLDPDSGCYYGLNEVGTCVWEFVRQPRRFADAVAHVCERFDVPRDECREDLERLLADLTARGLVTVTDVEPPRTTDA